MRTSCPVPNDTCTTGETLYSSSLPESTTAPFYVPIHDYYWSWRFSVRYSHSQVQRSPSDKVNQPRSSAVYSGQKQLDGLNDGDSQLVCARKAIRNKLHCRVYLSKKLLHECLPTFHQLNKYGGSPINCPSCGLNDENRDHIIRCPASPLAEWRRKFCWGAIDKFHAEHRTAPLLIHVLRSAMEDWCQVESDQAVSPILYPLDVRQLLLEQNAIGWRQLFSGRFSLEWSKIQHACYYYSKHRQKARNQRRDGSQWQVKLIGVMWDQWRLVWRMRNEAVHCHDAATRASAERAATDRNLREVLYDQRQHLEPHVASLLHQDEHERRSRSRETNQNWMAVNLAIIRRSVRRVKKRSARGMQSLRTYFTSVPIDE